MKKGLKILFLLIFTLGSVLLPQQSFYVQTNTPHEVCCCSSNDEHQAIENSTECCGTSCQDCAMFHSQNFSILYFQNEEFWYNYMLFKAEKINSFSDLLVINRTYSIWHPPKIS